MTKEIIATTQIKAEYGKYVYFCSPDENGYLTIVRANRSSRSLGNKNS